MTEDATISELRPLFVDQTGLDPAKPDIWPALSIPRAQIEREIERLADLSPPGNGQRSSAIVHPLYTGPGHGLTPGTDVVINVLKPGEESAPIRRNSNQIEICIGGTGIAEVNGEELQLSKWDVCNIPAMQRYRHRNTGKDLFVRLTYSNAPLLEKIGMHYFEHDPAVRKFVQPSPRLLSESAVDVEMPGGARLQSYEFLTDIGVVESKAHLWDWETVKSHLAFAPNTNLREILLLYNPVTERRAGTSPSFFATLAGGTLTRGPLPDRRGHRHSSASINYYMMGHGRSVVNGQTIYWEAGDLNLSAPAWSEHIHYFGSTDGKPLNWACMTIQDHPMHIALESLMWQEDLEMPILTLGSEEGINDYVSPRAKVAPK